MITEVIQGLSYSWLIVLMMNLLLGGCATLVLDEYDSVMFVNIPRETSFKTLYGQGFDTTPGGVEYVWMRRSINSVSAQVRCGGGSAITAKLSTKPEIAFLLGNLFLFPFWGHIIDLISQRAWGYSQPVDVGFICAGKKGMKNSKAMGPCRFNAQCIRKEDRDSRSYGGKRKPSSSSYKGPCPYPWSRDKAGNRCGKRSAYSRPGGK